MTDRELTDILRGKQTHPSQVNQEARFLEQRGLLIRKARNDGLLGNYPASPEEPEPFVAPKPVVVKTPEGLSEDELKEHLEKWLIANDWTATVAWGKSRGVDILATRRKERWIIEVKGHGSLQPMRVNYFIAMLGETLQRMADPESKYSIAMPDVSQFRGLWARLPELAKKRTQITALFVTSAGVVTQDPANEG